VCASEGRIMAGSDMMYGAIVFSRIATFICAGQDDIIIIWT